MKVGKKEQPSYIYIYIHIMSKIDVLCLECALQLSSQKYHGAPLPTSDRRNTEPSFVQHVHCTIEALGFDIFFVQGRDHHVLWREWIVYRDRHKGKDVASKLLMHCSNLFLADVSSFRLCTHWHQGQANTHRCFFSHGLNQHCVFTKLPASCCVYTVLS